MPYKATVYKHHCQVKSKLYLFLIAAHQVSSLKCEPVCVTELCYAPGPHCRLDYCDEAVRDSGQTVPVDIHQPPAFLHKILQLNSVQLLYETLGETRVRAAQSRSSVWGLSV